MLLVDVEAAEPLTLLVHLMSAGRLQLFDKRAGPRDRTSRLLVRAARRPRAAPARVRDQAARRGSSCCAPTGVDDDDALATLGPEAWPDPPPFDELLTEPRPLHSLLRDQHVIAGIGRSWVDEILWTAQLSPFKRGDDLVPLRRRSACARRRSASSAARSSTTRSASRCRIPDKLPMPLLVHRHQGEPCPRCGTTLEAVFYEDYVMTYCPHCQTEGRVLKDRRLSRLLK